MVTLVLVDVQKDFHPGGSLAIPTANEDAERIANLILQSPMTKISRIVATMDSHQSLHIAHPGFWISGDDDNNRHPDPFTLISSQDIIDGKWKPRKDIQIPVTSVDETIFDGLKDLVSSDDDDDGKMIDLYKYSIEYTKRLESKGKFQLCIWPEHCLIGSNGHGMVDIVFQAIQQWSHATGGSVEWVLKGEHLLTESYSALEAEVPVNTITAFNTNLQSSLQESDQLVICGQAMSHCVNYTTRSIVEYWPKDQLEKITILTDCASSVPGFDDASTTFLKEMEECGVKLQTSTELFPE